MSAIDDPRKTIRGHVCNRPPPAEQAEPSLSAADDPTIGAEENLRLLPLTVITPADVLLERQCSFFVGITFYTSPMLELEVKNNSRKGAMYLKKVVSFESSESEKIWYGLSQRMCANGVN